MRNVLYRQFDCSAFRIAYSLFQYQLSRTLQIRDLLDIHNIGFRWNMLCGCQMKKAEMEGQLESIDSPFQVRLIKFLGLHSIIL